MSGGWDPLVGKSCWSPLQGGRLSAFGSVLLSGSCTARCSLQNCLETLRLEGLHYKLPRQLYLGSCAHVSRQRERVRLWQALHVQASAFGEM